MTVRAQAHTEIKETIPCLFFFASFRPSFSQSDFSSSLQLCLSEPPCCAFIASSRLTVFGVVFFLSLFTLEFFYFLSFFFLHSAAVPCVMCDTDVFFFLRVRFFFVVVAVGVSNFFFFSSQTCVLKTAVNTNERVDKQKKKGTHERALEEHNYYLNLSPFPLYKHTRLCCMSFLFPFCFF